MVFKDHFNFMVPGSSYFSFIVIVLVLLFIKPVNGQGYVSPGIQLSVNDKYGATLSLQLTVGHIMDLGIPGFTLGVRTNQAQNTTFMDFQFVPSFLPFVGFGMGIANVKDIQSGSIQRMKRYKMWGGAIGLITIDEQWNEKSRQSNIGIMGVYPLLLGGNKSFYSIP